MIYFLLTVFIVFCYFFMVAVSLFSMPKLKGRIKPEDLCRITQNYQVILDDFDPNDGLLDYVFSKEIFTSHEVDIVKNDGANTSKGRSERFIDILTKSGDF